MKIIKIGKKEINLKNEFLEFFQNYFILDFLIINSLEKKENLVLNENLNLLIILIIEKVEKIENYCDIFLLINYLIIKEDKLSKNKNLLEFLKSKNEKIEIIYSFFKIFDKNEKIHSFFFENLILLKKNKNSILRKKDFYLFSGIINENEENLENKIIF